MSHYSRIRYVFNRLCRALRDRRLLPTCRSTAETPWGVRRCSEEPGHGGDHCHLSTPGQPWVWRREPEPEKLRGGPYDGMLWRKTP